MQMYELTLTTMRAVPFVRQAENTATQMNLKEVSQFKKNIEMTKGKEMLPLQVK